MQLQGTVSVLLAKLVNPNAVIPSGFSGFNLLNNSPQLEQNVMILEQRNKNLTEPTTLQANEDEQPQSQNQLTDTDQSLVEHDQNEYDQFQDDHHQVESPAIQSPQNHSDQSQNQAIQIDGTPIQSLQSNLHPGLGTLP